ncbi:hypothetical protein RCL1_006919 [Eukaryota sp. TZLM3-RCL]
MKRYRLHRRFHLSNCFLGGLLFTLAVTSFVFVKGTVSVCNCEDLSSNSLNLVPNSFSTSFSVLNETTSCLPKELLSTLSLSRPIDILIPWVNGSDPLWISKRNKYQHSDESVSANRFASHDELKFCLRSIEKFFHNYGTIYLLTDHQRPSWLNPNSPIKFISHQDIVPKNLHELVLPTFNSQAFEAFLWNIPGISDNYLYLNDDFFFANHVDVHYFLSNNMFTLWIDEDKVLNSKHQHSNDLYKQMVYHTSELTLKKFNARPRVDFRHLSHAPRLINKFLFKYVFDLFQDRFLEAAKTKFRATGSLVDPLSLFFHSLGTLSNMNNCSTPFVDYKLRYMSYVSLRANLEHQRRLFEALKVVKPPFFNINDNLDSISNTNHRVTGESLKMYYDLMNLWYSEKSSFEM